MNRRRCGKQRLKSFLLKIPSGRKPHPFFKDFGKIQRIAEAAEYGDFLHTGISLLHQPTGPGDPHGEDIIPDADVEELPEGGGQVFGIVGKDLTELLQMQQRISKMIVNVLLYEKEVFVTVRNRRYVLRSEAADSGKGMEQNAFAQQIQLAVFAEQTLSPEGKKGSVVRENVILPSDSQLMNQLICPGTDKADVQIGKICASGQVVGHRRQKQE